MVHTYKTDEIIFGKTHAAEVNTSPKLHVTATLGTNRIDVHVPSASKEDISTSQAGIIISFHCMSGEGTAINMFDIGCSRSKCLDILLCTLTRSGANNLISKTAHAFEKGSDHGTTTSRFDCNNIFLAIMFVCNETY